MSFLRSLTLLLSGRAAIVSTEPVTVKDPLRRLIVEFTFNSETYERRVITNMDHDYALDVQYDLSRSATREGSHAYASALTYVLGLSRGEPS